MSLTDKPCLVIKVGTSTLVGVDERPSQTFDSIAASIKGLVNNYRVILVTSGAIGFGMRSVDLDTRPTDIHDLQALSMMGQVGLLRRWREAMAPLSIGQVLVTSRELGEEVSRNKLRSSLQSLWDYRAIPIVNENDAITTEEISFGDNDKLAAEIAGLFEAEALVLLTDQDGIKADFGLASEYRLSEVSLRDIDQHVKHGPGSGYSKGGVDSKIYAARLALNRDVSVYVGHAGAKKSVENALSGQSGTKIIE